jgi:hypothetical protein
VFLRFLSIFRFFALPSRGRRANVTRLSREASRERDIVISTMFRLA